ncbi:MAG: 30S ribosomal protein S17 [Elusimicrobiota bacterium]|jgi:small subunit ribosomal protein S17|nr:30S ribosomal protein S17 [Elusimicrobiota bacterium]
MDVKKKRVLEGKVVSDKMNKTRVVLVTRKVRHPLYDKIITKTTRYMIHDENNVSKLGDIVEISYLRPISANKSWELLKVLKKALI